MKIVFIHTDLRIYWPARLKALDAYLKEKGHELFVIEIAGKGSPYSFAEKRKDVFPNWQILFPNAKMEELHAKDEIKKKVFAALNKINPDVVVGGAIAFPSGALSTAWVKKNKKKIVIFDDTKKENVVRSKMVDFIKQQIYHCVDAVIYPSSSEWMDTGNYWGFKKEQIFGGIDVVDNSFWDKKRNNKTQRKPYFLSVGRLLACKNYLFLLEVYNNYRKAVGEKDAYDLILIGNGPMRSQIEDYLQFNHLHGVSLLDFVQQEDLAGFYKNAEAFILPSYQETWGLVINEALASGTVVFASTACGATNSLIVDGEDGYKFSPYNKKELFDKLVSFQSLSSETKCQMKMCGKEIVGNWGLDKFVQGVYDAISYVASCPSHTPNIKERIILSLWKGRYNPL